MLTVEKEGETAAAATDGASNQCTTGSCATETESFLVTSWARRRPLLFSSFLENFIVSSCLFCSFPESSCPVTAFSLRQPLHLYSTLHSATCAVRPAGTVRQPSIQNSLSLSRSCRSERNIFLLLYQLIALLPLFLRKIEFCLLLMFYLDPQNFPLFEILPSMIFNHIKLVYMSMVEQPARHHDEE